RIRWTKDLDQGEAVEVSARGPLVGAVVARHRWNNSTFTTWIGLRAGSRQVDFRLVADWREKGTPQEGSPMLKVAFPTTLREPVFTCDIPFGTVARSPGGQDVPAGMWADLTEVVRTTESSRAVPVDLSAYFDHDAFATDEQPSDGDFDSMGMSYPVSIFASARDGLMDFGGLPWRVPPTSPGAKNAIRAAGQTIQLPGGPAETITIFGASAPSADGGHAKLVFRDGTQETVPLSFSDWCFGPEAGEEIAVRSPHRFEPSGRTGPECRIFARSYPIPKGKVLSALVLPRAPRLRIFAITLGPRVEARPVYGVALLNDCKHGYDASGSTLRLTLLRASYDPDPEPDLGVHEIGYSLLPHGGGWAEAGVVRAAWELNNPVAAEMVESHVGRLPPAASLVSLEPANLVLAAVKRAEHGDELVARWYDSAGRETQARLKLGFGVRAARLTNVVEAEDRGAIAVGGGEVVVSTKACGIATVRVVPASRGSFPRPVRPAG
ncbi:MAG: glycosyl hydrolase-related protein, partial [Armatimonadetes bacterium]|nr:glycosyl hydrolase-related protein [Armatimonadota bacterium]